MPRAPWTLLVLLAGGCVTPAVGSSVYPTAGRTTEAAAAQEAAPPAAAAPGRWDALPVTTTREPAGAVEVAVVEVHGRRGPATLEGLVREFRQRVGEAGGDLARIDRFGTRYEMITEQYTYDCGTTRIEHQTRTVFRTDGQGRSYTTTETVPVTKHEPKTCFGTRQVEAATLTLTGRAMRTASEGKP